MTISENQHPPTPGYVAEWERGEGPWHADAFVGTSAEGRFETGEPRKSGWFALDFCGNAIGFVADGTEYE